jgi:chloramphenicol-sensitive protein RarD
VIVIVVGYGELPWVSLGLAATFGVYGLLKKRVGGSVDAVSGLTVETLALSPFALAFLVWLSVQGTLVLGTQGAAHTLLMAASGVITAVPLLLFAAGSRRLPLTIMGVTQYVAPILQLIVGLFISGEHMSTERWLGFGIVWIALIVLTVDMFVHGSRRRGAAIPQTP